MAITASLARAWIPGGELPGRDDARLSQQVITGSKS
jgi:hypothetical protein